jgi:hypothetical protein
MSARQTLGRGNVGHVKLMLKAFLSTLKRDRHVQYLFAMLCRTHAATRKTRTIPDSRNLVDDRRMDIAATQKIGV